MPKTSNSHISKQDSAKNEVFSTDPVQIVKAAGSRLYCSEGQVYIDLSSQNPYNLMGHNIKEIQTCLQESLANNQLTTYLSPETAQTQKLCHKIHQQLPPTQNWSIEFFNADHHAVEQALKTAYSYWHAQNQTKRTHILTFAHSHHGESLSCTNLNASFENHNHFEEFLIPTEHIPYPNTWHLDKKVHIKEELALTRLEEFLIENHHKCAAILIEPLLQTHNGMQACRPDFLNKVITLVKKYDIIIITDERYLSPMRSGRFFASQYLKHYPDIMILGNCLTNNICPLGTLIITDKIKAKIQNSKQYKGNNVINRIACVAATTTLEILEKSSEEKHIQKIQTVHANRLLQLNKQPIIKNIRYLGAIGAFEIICEDRSQQSKLIDWFYKNCIKNKILLNQYTKNICLSPPLCLSIKDLNKVYDTIESIIKTIPLKYITSCLD